MVQSSTSSTELYKLKLYKLKLIGQPYRTALNRSDPVKCIILLIFLSMSSQLSYYITHEKQSLWLYLSHFYKLSPETWCLCCYYAWVSSLRGRCETGDSRNCWGLVKWIIGMKSWTYIKQILRVDLWERETQWKLSIITSQRKLVTLDVMEPY